MARRPTADVLIVGAGVTGAALAYEAARRGLSVQVCERAVSPAERDERSATGGSLGGLTWIGLDDTVSPLAFEGLERHRLLSAEIETDTSFRPHSLLSLATDPETLARLVKALERGRDRGFVGQRLEPEEAAHLEPALNPASVAGGVLCEQGLIDPAWFTQALLDAAERAGASIDYGVAALGLIVENDRCTGVETNRGSVLAGQVVVAAGAWTAPLLATAGVDIPVLYSHAEFLETEPMPPSFFHIVGDAAANRGRLERAMAEPRHRASWREMSDAELVPHAVDFDLAQFPDGRMHIGQVSRAIPSYRSFPHPESEEKLRTQLRRFFPSIAGAPATLRLFHVAISPDRRPVVGQAPGIAGLYVVSGLPSPLIFVPVLAQRVARLLSGEPQPELTPFDPGRFGASNG